MQTPLQSPELQPRLPWNQQGWGRAAAWACAPQPGAVSKGCRALGWPLLMQIQTVQRNFTRRANNVEHQPHAGRSANCFSAILAHTLKPALLLIQMGNQRL